MSLLLALLYVAPPEPEPVKRGSGSAQKKPQRSKYEVDRFSDFKPQPIAIRSDDDELMLIYMMQGG